MLTSKKKCSFYTIYPPYPLPPPSKPLPSPLNHHIVVCAHEFFLFVFLLLSPSSSPNSPNPCYQGSLPSFYESCLSLEQDLFLHVLIQEIFVVIMCWKLLDINKSESYSDRELIVQYIGYDMDIKNHNQRHKGMTCVCLIYVTFNTASLLQYYSKHIKGGHTQQYQLEAFFGIHLFGSCLVLSVLVATNIGFQYFIVVPWFDTLLILSFLPY